MEVLKGFPEDFAKALHTSFYMLKIFNIRYLEDEKPFLKKNWRYSYIGATVLIHTITLSLYIPELPKGDELTTFAYLMPSILVTINAILKSFALIPKTRQLSALLRELGSLWRVNCTPSQRQEKKSLLRKLSFINRATFLTTVTGASQYLLSPLLVTLFRRFILKQNGDLLLPFAASYPFNPTKNWLIYSLVYIFQLYSMIIIVCIYIGASLVMTTSCALLGIEFVMLRDDLAHVKSKPDRERNLDVDTDGCDDISMETFVVRHQTLLRLSAQLDNVFNVMVFIDLLFVGITTCAFSFMGQFAGGSYMVVGYLGIASNMLSVLYLCYYGELLIRASSSIGDTAYDNLWYKGDREYKVATFLIIIMSQKPCCLTSMRYAEVSLKMFTKVVSTTWSYFSLMNTVYSEE